MEFKILCLSFTTAKNKYCRNCCHILCLCPEVIARYQIQQQSQNEASQIHDFVSNACDNYRIGTNCKRVRRLGRPINKSIHDALGWTLVDALDRAIHDALADALDRAIHDAFGHTLIDPKLLPISNAIHNALDHPILVPKLRPISNAIHHALK